MKIVEIFRRTNITATLHRSGVYSNIAKLDPLLGEETWKHLEFAQKKALKVSSDSEKEDSLVWWTSILSIMFEKVKCAASSLMLWVCFSAAGTEGLVRVEEKLIAPKYWESLYENSVQSIQNLRLGRRFTFQ